MAKFSTFINDNECRIGDQIVGLRNGVNGRFAFPANGIKDIDGNWVLKWSTQGALSVNNIHFYNALTGDPVIIKPEGTDSSVSLEISSYNHGNLTLIAPGNGNINLNLSGSGDVNISPAAGEVIINSVLSMNGNIALNGNDITSTGNITLSPDTGLEIDLDSDNVWIGENLQHAGDIDNKISFGADIQDFITGGGSRIDLSNLGFRVGGSGARITSISDDTTMAADSSTLSVTQHAAKTYADSVGGGSVTLTSAGGTETLVNDGTGPTLATKGLSFGTEFNIGSSATAVAISLTIPIAIATGGTNNTVLGASGTLAQSDGSKISYTTATYPGTSGTSGTLLTSNGTNIVNTTATYPGTAGTSGTILRSNGTNIVNSTPTFPDTATTGKLLRANGTNWVESTATFEDTYSASTLLYSNGANTVTGLATANSAVLVTNSSGVPSLSSTMTNGQLIIGSTSGTPTAATLTAGTGVTITNGAGSITIAVNGATTWTEVTGTSQSMAVNNGYVANNASLVTCTLPTTAAIGDFVRVSGKGAGLFKIGQNASQVIRTGTTDTTTGTGGSLTATNRYDCLTLRCITANTDWVLESVKGAFTIV